MIHLHRNARGEIDFYFSDELGRKSPRYTSEEACKHEVLDDGMNLQYAEKQTEEMCLLAVASDGMALQFVEKQTPEICRVAVKRDWRALQFVAEQTKELCKMAIDCDVEAMRYVRCQSRDICLYAISRDVSALQWIKGQTDQICMDALIKDVRALQFIHEPSWEMMDFIAKSKRNGPILMDKKPVPRPLEKDVDDYPENISLSYEPGRFLEKDDADYIASRNDLSSREKRRMLDRLEQETLYDAADALEGPKP